MASRTAARQWGRRGSERREEREADAQGRQAGRTERRRDTETERAQAAGAKVQVGAVVSRWSAGEQRGVGHTRCQPSGHRATRP